MLSNPGQYVGRLTERARLDAAWARAVAGHTQAVVLTAEAGMGKSRLAAELAVRVHAEGAQVLLGACVEEGHYPYEPFAQAIRADLASLDAVEVDRRIGSHREALARLLPELSSSRMSRPEGLDESAARGDLLAGLHGYFSRAATGPTLLVVEDVHWATPTTLDVVRHIARAAGSAPLLLLLTARDVAPDLDRDLAVFLADLARLPTVEQIAVRGLSFAEVAELVTGLGSDEDPAQIVAQAAGNPLLVNEVVNRFDRSLAASLPGLLLRRYALLDEADLAVLDVAAVLGAVFDAEMVATAMHRPVEVVLASLDQAARAGLVTGDDPRRPLQWSFVHALFRTARYDAIAPHQRLILHHDVMRALSDRAEDPRVLPELARHACVSAAVGDPRAAIAWAGEAAALAERSFAFSEAADHHREALEAAELLRPTDPALRLRLQIRLGELLQGAGDPAYLEVLTAAARTARAAGDVQALAEVAWAMVRYGGPGHHGHQRSDLATITEDALAGLGSEPTAARARTLAVAAEELCFLDPVRAAQLAHEARDLARRLGDPITLGHVLLSYRIAARTPDNLDARHPTADELIDIGRTTGEMVFTALGLATRAWSAREAGDVAASDHAIDLATASSGPHLPPTFTVAVTLFRSAATALRGDLAAAERSAESVLGMTTDGFDATNWYGPALVMLRHAQGRLPELIPLLEGVEPESTVGSVYQSALAVAYAQADRAGEATALVDELTTDDLGAVSWNFTWLASLVALSEAAERTGNEAAAGVLAAALEPYRGRLADLPQAVIAPVDLALAQLALTRGDRAEAAVAASRAVEASRQRGTVVFLARELVRLAAAGGGDHDVAQLVAEALDIADRTGAHLVRQEAEFYGLVASVARRRTP